MREIGNEEIEEEQKPWPDIYADFIRALDQISSDLDSNPLKPKCIETALYDFTMAVLSFDPTSDTRDVVYAEHHTLLEEARILATRAGFPNGLRTVLGDEVYDAHFDI